MSNNVENAATANASLYSTRLEPRHIRLLRLEPPSAFCTFEVYSLEDVPEYHAISYTWRSAELEYGISENSEKYAAEDDAAYHPPNDEVYHLEVDGRNHFVSKNIYDIVMRVNDYDDINYLWIDSLCINQADPIERSAQVGMMGEIYSLAVDVAVWLGLDERNEVDTVVEICDVIQAEFLRQRDAWTGGNFRVQKITNLFEPATKAKLGLGFVTPEGWKAFARFWDRRWFHRAWIVQEASLTSRTRFFWHKDEINSEMLFDVSRFLMDAETGLSVEPAFDVPKKPTARPREWFVLRRKLGETLAKIRALKSLIAESPEESLNDEFYRKLDTLGGPNIVNGRERTDSMRIWTHLLEIYRAFDATDPRDHVYATLGILKATAKNHGLDPPPIVVDYTLPVAEVYADAAKHIMEAGNCVNLLSLVQDPSTCNQQSLPSWVPDFSAGYNCPILMNKPRRRKVMSNLYRLAQSDGDGTTKFKISDSLKVLSMKALQLDEVVAVGETQYELTSGGMWEKTAQILLSHSTFSPQSTKESRIESLWRTLIANTSYNGRDIAPSNIGSDFKAFMTTSLVMKLQHDPKHLEKLPSLKMLIDMEMNLMKSTRTAHGVDPVVLTFDEALEKSAEADRRWTAIEAGGPLPESTPIASKAARFANAMEPMFYRRIILTRQGHLGIGPLSTEPGDQVWVMPGAPLPAILRRSTEIPYRSVNISNLTFSILGESYLHGDPDFSGSTIKWQWIKIE